MPRSSSLFPTLLRVALGLFFLVIGLQKVSDLTAFTESVFNYQILYPPYDAYAAYLVAWLEVVTGLALIIGLWGVRGALVIIAGLLFTFINALAIAAAKGLNINCGCFGQSDEPTNFPLHIGMNVCLLALTLYLFWHQVRKGQNRRYTGTRLVLPD